MKEGSQLTASDLKIHPVWRFTGGDTPSETAVVPLKCLPARSVAGAIIGSEVQLAAGKRLIAILGNLKPANPRLTEHFLTLSVFRDDGALFHLARYHDYDAEQRGPKALAEFLGLKESEVFPITWDVRHLVHGDPTALRGKIESEPKVRLSRAEVIALAVP